jgi:hypothetical protein
MEIEERAYESARELIFHLLSTSFFLKPMDFMFVTIGASRF